MSDFQPEQAPESGGHNRQPGLRRGLFLVGLGGMALGITFDSLVTSELEQPLTPNRILGLVVATVLTSIGAKVAGAFRRN